MFLICTAIVSYSVAQVERFDIEYPWLSDIKKLKEDSLGYIWFHDGTDFYSFNGHQTYPSGLDKALGKKKYEYEIKGDIVFKDKQILFLNHNKLSLFHYEDKSIEDVWSPPASQKIEHIYQDDVNTIWVFTSDIVNDTKPVFLSKNGKDFDLAMNLPPFNEDTGIFWDFEITDKDGILYIHDRLGGLLMLDKKGNELKLKLSDQSDFDNKYPCSQFRLDNKNQLWRIWEDQFEIYDESEQSFKTHPLSGSFPMQNFCNRNSGIPLLNLRSIFQDSKGRIWLANAASYLLMYQPELNTSLNFRKPLVEKLEGGAQDIEALYEDKNGNIWGFKKGGIFKIRDKVNYFNSYTVDTYKSDHPIYQNKGNKTLQKILIFYDDFAIKNTSVHSIEEDSEGNIYYQDGTLSLKINVDNGKLEILPFFTDKEKVHLYLDDSIGIFSCWDNYFSFDKNFNVRSHNSKVNKIEKTFRQKNGTIWLAGLIDQHNNMFGMLEPHSLEFAGNFVDSSGQVNFSEVHVTDIKEDENNNLVISSDHGIMYIDTKKNRISILQNVCTYEGAQYTLSNDVDQIYCLKDNLLWFKNKYEIGLLNTETNILIHRLQIDENFHGPKLKIVPYGDSVVWIGNKLGIAYHNFNNDLSIQVSKEEGIDCKEEVTILKKISNGNLVAGTNNGLYIFHPDSLLSNYLNRVQTEENIPLRLTAYSFTEGKSDSLINIVGIQDVDLLSLEYSDRMLKLQYSLLNYNHPSRNRYQHWLEGYESTWSLPTNENTVNYSSLPYGDYTFHVKGTIGSGVWSKQILSIPIEVKNAWYNTWWASLILTLCIVSIIYLFFRNRYNQVLKYERLRSDISKDLHDDVGTILTGIAMQSELLENNADEKLKNIAHKIASNSREAMGRMRDTVWAIDSRKDTTADLQDRILDYAEDILVPKDIQLNLNIDITSKEFKIEPNVRQAVYLIAKESLNNIVKHSDTDKVDISLVQRKKELYLKIKDFGSKSIQKSSGLGISNMKERAKSISGNYSFKYDENGYETLLKINL